MSTIPTSQKLEAAKIVKSGGKNWRDLALGEAPLKDGGSPMVFDGEQLAQGMPVFVETDTAAGFEPYPDGVYTLADGRSVEVKEGFITKISDMAQTDSADPEQKTGLTPEQETAIKKITETHTKETIYAAIKEATDKVKAEFEAAVKPEVEKQVKEIQTNYETKLSAQNKTIDDLSKIVSSVLEVLKTKPAAKPAHNPSTALSSHEKNLDEIKLEEAENLFQYVQKQRKS